MKGDNPDDGGSKYLWNTGKLIPDYTAQHPRGQSSSDSLCWDFRFSRRRVWRAITLTMEAVSTSETPVNFYQPTPCNIPEASRLRMHLVAEPNKTALDGKVRSVHHFLPQFCEPRRHRRLIPDVCMLWVTYQRLLAGPRSKGHLWNMMWKTKDRVRGGIAEYDKKGQGLFLLKYVHSCTHTCCSQTLATSHATKGQTVPEFRQPAGIAQATGWTTRVQFPTGVRWDRFSDPPNRLSNGKGPFPGG
jgi:hypothetical protein